MNTAMPRVACLIWGLIFIPACGSQAPPDPTAADAFIRDYQAAYEAKDREAIMLWVDWHGVDEALREYTKQDVFPYAGWREIRSIEHAPYEAAFGDTRAHENKAIVPSAIPTYRVTLIFEPEHRNAQPERYELLLVERDGEIKLCGWAYEQ